MRTVANADKIVVLDNGVVAESGSPEKLLAAKGIFAGMAARDCNFTRCLPEFLW
jgi:ATP-binding cassette subfamily B protein